MDALLDVLNDIKDELISINSKLDDLQGGLGYNLSDVCQGIQEINLEVCSKLDSIEMKMF